MDISLEEETAACVMVAEAYAYNKRLRLNYGSPYARANYRVDQHGHLCLLITYDDINVFETCVSRPDEWEAWFRQAWGIYEQRKQATEAIEIRDVALAEQEKMPKGWMKAFRTAWDAAEQQVKKENDAA